MRLLRKYLAAEDAYAAQSMLREHGILSSVFGSEAKRMSVFTGTMEVTLWVLIDEQFNDASALLENENHHVSSALTEEQIQELEANSQRNASEAINKVGVWFFGSIIIIIVLYVAYGILTEGAH